MRFRLNVDEPNEEIVTTDPRVVCWPICTGRVGLEKPLTKDHMAGEVFRYEPILEARGMNNPYLAFVPWDSRKACCYSMQAPVRLLHLMSLACYMLQVQAHALTATLAFAPISRVYCVDRSYYCYPPVNLASLAVLLLLFRCDLDAGWRSQRGA